MKHKVLLQSLGMKGADRRMVAHLFRDQPETKIIPEGWGKNMVIIPDILIFTHTHTQSYSCNANVNANMNANKLTVKKSKSHIWNAKSAVTLSCVGPLPILIRVAMYEPRLTHKLLLNQTTFAGQRDEFTLNCLWNLSSLCEIPDRVDSYWNDWFGLRKFTEQW